MTITEIVEAKIAALEKEVQRLHYVEQESVDTQAAIVDLAVALGIDAEARWDHDSCPNNSDIILEITPIVRGLKEALESIQALTFAPVSSLQAWSQTGRITRKALATLTEEVE